MRDGGRVGGEGGREGVGGGTDRGRDGGGIEGGKGRIDNRLEQGEREKGWEISRRGECTIV